MKPKVSIVLPVCNGERTLSLCLDSLMNLDFIKESLEIIVVDNNSTDTTKNIIRHYPVKYVFESKRGRASARNKGVKESKGELVAFIDADCIADRHWLKNIVTGFSSESIGGCGGEIFSLNFPHLSIIEKYYYFKGLLSQKKGLISTELFLPRIATGNAAYRREVLEEVGLFDNSFIAIEDVDLSWRVYLKGYKLNYVPEAIVYHKHPDRLTDFFRRWFERGCAYTRLVQKYSNFKRPLVNRYDWSAFLFQQLQSLRLLSTTLFTEKDIVRRIFPVLDIIKDTALFSGRYYGLAQLKWAKADITYHLVSENKVLWRIAHGKVIISELARDFYYVLDNVGSKVWTLYMEGKEVSEIVDILADEYGTDRETVKNDVIGFINELKKERLFKENKE